MKHPVYRHWQPAWLNRLLKHLHQNQPQPLPMKIVPPVYLKRQIDALDLPPKQPLDLL